MTDRDAKPKKPWLTTFFRSIIVGQFRARRHHETGFRDPFVEVPRHRLPKPSTPEDRQREAFVSAIRNLTETQRSDRVEHLDHSVEQFREGLARIFKSLSDEYRSDERISDLDVIVHQLAWRMEWRLEQVATICAYIRKHCPSGLAARILQDSAPRADKLWAPNAAFAPRCGGDEHAYQVGAPRCDCGKVAVRVVEAIP